MTKIIWIILGLIGVLFGAVLAITANVAWQFSVLGNDLGKLKSSNSNSSGGGGGIDIAGLAKDAETVLAFL